MRNGKHTFSAIATLILLACVGIPKLFCEQTLALTPSAVSIKGEPGGSATQVFEVSNLTDSACSFQVEVADVMVEDGKRKFVPAGQSTNGIAELVTVPVENLEIQPGQQTSIPVTFVIPSQTDFRAVAVFFNGRFEGKNSPQNLRIRLGTVVDFTLTNNIDIGVSQPEVQPQTATSNTIIIEHLNNIGKEPVIVNGVAAIVDQAGTLVGKTSFKHERLLPGEYNPLKAEYSGTLAPGRYRVFCSLQYGGKTQTTNTEFSIQ